MNKEIEFAFMQISAACAEYKGTKQEHIALEQYLNVIKQALIVEKPTKQEELNGIVNKQ